jgi:hypothetical protein
MTTNEVFIQAEVHDPQELLSPARPMDRAKIDGEEEHLAALFLAEESESFRRRWTSIQGSFVDNPRAAVEMADELVAETTRRLEEVFAGERAKLEADWSKGSDVSTEGLRQALRHYRSFFDRLLSV